MRIDPLAESVLINFLAFSVSKASLSVLSDLSFLLWKKCFKLNAANKFVDILSCSEFVGFLGYGNEVEAFVKNRFFSV